MIWLILFFVVYMVCAIFNLIVSVLTTNHQLNEGDLAVIFFPVLNLIVAIAFLILITIDKKNNKDEKNEQI